METLDLDLQARHISIRKCEKLRKLALNATASLSFSKLEVLDCQQLRSFGLLWQTADSLERTLQADSLFDFKFKPPLSELQEFSFGLRAQRCYPNFTGLRFQSTQTPLVYEQKTKDKLSAYEALSKYFHFMRRVLKEDLYRWAGVRGGKSDLCVKDKQLFDIRVRNVGAFLEKRNVSNREWEQYP